MIADLGTGKALEKSSFIEHPAVEELLVQSMAQPTKVATASDTMAVHL